MKKEYINPELQVIKFAAPVVLQNASREGGVSTGSLLGGEHNADDVTYSSGFFDNGDSENW